MSEKLFQLFRPDRRNLKILAACFPILAFFAAVYHFTDRKLGSSILLSSSGWKQWDKDWGFWAIHAITILAVTGLVLNGKFLWTTFRNRLPSRNASISILAIALFCATFTWTQVEKQHRVLSDESSWESMALQMLHSHRGGTCNQGWFDENKKLTCTDEVNNFKGKASGYLYYLLYHVGPATRNTALQANFVLYVLSILLIFHVLFLALGRAGPALSAAAVLGTFPIFMMQSQTATTEVLYVFLLLLLMEVILLFSSTDTRWRHFLLLIPLMGLYAQTRQESLFSFLPFILWYLPFFRKRIWHLPIFILVLIAACWPIINTILAYKGYDFQGGDYAPHSLENFAINLWANIEIFFNLKPGLPGLMKYPFSTTITVLLLLGTLYLSVAAVIRGRHRTGALLILAHQPQAFLVLLNVSGHFSIDINQRYILVALPAFAIIISLFLDSVFRDLFKHLPEALAKRLPSSFLATSTLLFLTLTLTLYHTKSFNKNIMYRKNKLLAEEKLLDTKLKENPSNSVYIYARPWQMLASGFNSFSESAFLAWSPQTYDKWKRFSNGHIYLVRGQDGFGKVNRKSRVVGFKSTGKVEQILEKYEHEVLYKNAKDFGYPLSITRLGTAVGRNPWESKVAVVLTSTILEKQQPTRVEVFKEFAENVPFRLTHENKVLLDTLLRKNKSIFTLDFPTLSAGPKRLDFHFELPDQNSYSFSRWIFLQKDGARLLSDLNMKTLHQGWGSPNKNKSVENATLSIADKEYAFGIGSHAPSTLAFSLNGKERVFRSKMGMDDESLCGDGAIFIVQGDGRELYRSQALHAHELDSLEVSLRSVRELRLVTEENEGTFCDHADWINAWIQ